MGDLVQIPRNQFGVIWSRLNPWVGSCLGPWLAPLSFKSWALQFSSFCGFKLIDFPSQMVTLYVLASFCHFLVLDPHLKAIGLILWLSSNRIALFHWTLDLEHSCKAGHNTVIGQLWPVRWIINQFWRFQKNNVPLYCTRFSIFLPKKKCSLEKKHFILKISTFFLQTITISVEAAKVLTPVDEVCTLPVYWWMDGWMDGV
jgi:hypothetical protein